GLGNIVVSDASEQFNGTGGIPGAVLSGGNKTLTVPLASITGPMITFDGMGGNDTLTAVLTSALGKTLTFNGGDPTSTPGDKLVLSGGSATSVTHTFTSANSGSVNVDGTTINYTGLEPITDNLTAVNRSFVYAAGSEAITLTGGAGSNTITSTLAESVTFGN